MSNKLTDLNSLSDPERRDILRAASAVAVGGIAASAFAMASSAIAQNASGDRDSGPLGRRLRGCSISASPCRIWTALSSSTPKCSVATK